MIYEAPIKPKRKRQYSSNFLHAWNIHEEVANSITHGLGFGLSITALVLLVLRALFLGSDLAFASGLIFGISLILAYTVSMVYHAILHPPTKYVLRILDHASIYILIAGSYTPFALITLHGPLGWSLFGVIWSIAIIGIILKLRFIGRYETFSLILYLLMGWIAVAVIVQLIEHLPTMGLIFLGVGGLMYSLGVFFFIYEKFPFFHTIWHLFVLAGSVFHFFCIYLYVIS